MLTMIFAVECIVFILACIHCAYSYTENNATVGRLLDKRQNRIQCEDGTHQGEYFCDDDCIRFRCQVDRLGRHYAQPQFGQPSICCPHVVGITTMAPAQEPEFCDRVDEDGDYIHYPGREYFTSPTPPCQRCRCAGNEPAACEDSTTCSRSCDGNAVGTVYHTSTMPPCDRCRCTRTGAHCRTSTNCGVTGCPRHWIYKFGKCYFAAKMDSLTDGHRPEKQTWDKAKRLCEKKHGVLVMPKNIQEKAYVMTLARSIQTSRANSDVTDKEVMLGIRYQGYERGWLYLDNTFGPLLSSFGYDAWNGNDCKKLNVQTGHWEDIFCGSRRGVNRILVCERSWQDS